MTIGSLITILEELDQDQEIVVEIMKEDGETTETYDIGYDYSDTGDFMLRVHV